MRDEGAGEAEVSLEGVTHYLKIHPRFELCFELISVCGHGGGSF